LSVPLSITKRPFSVEPSSGLMFPDGIFDTCIRRQLISVFIRNDGPDRIKHCFVRIADNVLREKMSFRRASILCFVLFAAYQAQAQTEIPIFNSVKYLQTGQTLAQLCSGFSGTVEVTISTTVSANTVLPSSCAVRIASGGSITTSSGQYLQITGPFSAGLYQVFYGSGSVYFYGGASSVEKVYPQWFGAMGNAKAGGFECDSGSSTLRLFSSVGSGEWAVGDNVTLVGEGTSGGNLSATISSISTNTSVSISPATCATTTSKYLTMFNVDDTAALNAWTASLRGTTFAGAFPGTVSGYNMSASLGPSLLYVPKGQYNAGCLGSPVQFYTGEVVTFEASNTNQSAVFNQCNINNPAVVWNPNNYSPSGSITTLGIGNATLNNFNIRSANGDADVNQPAIIFEPAALGWFDTRLNDLMCEGINGSCIQIGFETTTSASSGATTISLGNGAYFSNSQQITIVGAGTSGSNLITTIQAGGGTNNVTINPGIAATVSSAAVYPTTDAYNLLIRRPENDVAGYYFIEALYNASGSVAIDNGELYNPKFGAIYSNASSINWRITNTVCTGCGQPNIGISAEQSAIYDVDNTQSKTAELVIDASEFGPLPSGTWGGNVSAEYLNSLDIHNTQMWDVDNSQPYKVLTIGSVNLINISGSTFNMKTFVSSPTPASRMVELYGSAAQMFSFCGNNLQNNSSKTLSYQIYYDTTPALAQFCGGGNNFYGSTYISNGTVPYMQQATTGSVGGSALTAGTCAIGTAALGIAATGHPAFAAASDGTVQGNYMVQATTNGMTVTVSICAITAGTPTPKTYNVTVF